MSRAARERQAQARSAWLRRMAGFALAGSAFAGSALAQIRTDSSLGQAGQSLAGPNYAIPQSLGKLSGANLFHSFQTFNIHTGESATFTTSSAGIANVISRVTGGTASQINGRLALQAASGTPALYFINPAGVVFGAGASVDVPGAFHVSAADYVKFPDGRFYADAAAESAFSSAAPEAFGLLGTRRGAITINGGALLAPGTGQPISLTASDIEIDNAVVQTSAAGIRVVAAGGGALEIPFEGNLPPASGNLSLYNGAQVIAHAAGAVDGGDVLAAAGDLTVDGSGGPSEIGTSSDDVGNAGAVRIEVAGLLQVLDGGQIGSIAFADGSAGAVQIRAGDVIVAGTGSRIRNIALGEAGPVHVQVSETLQVLEGGTISSVTLFNLEQGSLQVRARNMLLDDGDVVTSTVDGKAASLAVGADEFLLLLPGSSILSDTFGSGNAGAVKVGAGSLLLFGGVSSARIASETDSSTDGRAGDVEVDVDGMLGILSGGLILSSTNGYGEAGSVRVAAGDIEIDGGGQLAGIRSTGAFWFDGDGAAGSVEVHARGTLRLFDGASISSDAFGDGDGGSVKVSAPSILVDGSGVIASISSRAAAIGDGKGGSVAVSAERDLRVVNAGTISSVTNGVGDAGAVYVDATDITVDGQGLYADISSSGQPFSSAAAGSVTVTARGTLRVVDGGAIATDALGTGRAGVVTVQAEQIYVDDRNAAGRGNSNAVTAISSDTAGGPGGEVSVVAERDIALVGGGKISANTFGGSDAGSVRVVADNLSIDGANATVTTGIFTAANPLSTGGDAGSLMVTVAGMLSIVGGGTISSESRAAGNAGSVQVKAANIRIDALGQEFVTGITSDARGEGTASHAGDVRVAASGSIHLVRGATISSDTYTDGDAGSVHVSAANIIIDRRTEFFTGISSDTITVGAAGNAGNVHVSAAQALRVLNGGAVTSNTFSDGAAGSVVVRAATVVVDGTNVFGRSSRISAQAQLGSSGQTGDVSVVARDSITVSNDALISVANDAEVPDPTALTPTEIFVSAPAIRLFGSGGDITAAATGNVAASNIRVRFGPLLSLDDSSITTSAQDGNGGAISIGGDGLLLLKDSLINTSVFGLAGDGGNIDVRARTLVLDTGFIQANTEARNARGGDVSIDVQTLLPSGNVLFVGGDTQLQFRPFVPNYNVIQAAAPTGVSGAVTVSSPALDLSGTLAALEANVVDSGGLGRNPCRTGAGSSFAQTGRGGLPPSARGLLGAGAGRIPVSGALGGPIRIAWSQHECAQ